MIWLNHAPRNSLADLRLYNRAADMAGCDIYHAPPNLDIEHSDLPDKGLTSVGAFTERMRADVARGVVLIDPADAMNAATANALLKTLEEPPPGWTLILITARPDALLPTMGGQTALNLAVDLARQGTLAQYGVDQAHVQRPAGAAEQVGNRGRHGITDRIHGAAESFHDLFSGKMSHFRCTGSSLCHHLLGAFPICFGALLIKFINHFDHDQQVFFWQLSGTAECEATSFKRIAGVKV